MSNATQTEVGTVASLWRYPVKSMMGEELPTAHVSEHGLLGDRTYALIDGADGKVATAKNPGKWPTLFAFRATFLDSPSSRATVPPVRITLPDGTTVTSAQRECNQALSKALNRQVTLAATARGQVTGVPSSLPASWTAKSEEYWPDIEGLDHRDTVTDFALPTGTFFDGATVHLLTTATLNRLRDVYPQGRFEVPRFRPNLVVEPVGGEKGFVEQTWIGHTLAIGGDVRLRITGSCGRCVMTTLAQGNLPKDSGILRTAVQQNHGHMGVYASVVQGGTISRGDRVKLSA
ncbi:MAG: MOSC domain-containing protein [Nitrospiraceae bacterium]